MSEWINWSAFTPMPAVIGGICIGLAAALLILGIGRILGMSGIVKNALFIPTESLWQLVFIGSMAVTTWVYMATIGFPKFTIDKPWWLIIVAGLLVGFGTRLGSGCTSGHGVCGISRLSSRSLVATLVFMVFGIATATFTSMLTF